MKPELYVHNTLSGKKEKFNPIRPPFVGLYVCGPTVYGEAHLGHARSAITFDIVFRYLRELGYKVRYVRNITDVGHLTGDTDEGEDKIQKKARLEQLEPMEVADYYADRYHEDLRKLNVLRPSLEPRATGHIIEQIAYITKIVENGYAYESHGSVYFDVATYAKDHSYGELSGRIPDELLNTTRQLSGQEEKRNPQDFALWKKASADHLMRWPSPWSDGFPGWHIECSAMSSRYLGEEFDIHGGGMDLLFPHHESEVAQSRAVTGKGPARYWLHNNMITVDGQKMGKSLNNFINIQQLLNGDHPRLEQAYDPMTLRFFVLQAHYRGTLDFSNDALQAAGKALSRLSNAAETLKSIIPSGSGSEAVKLKEKAYNALSDDFNTPIAIAQLFDAAHLINNAKAGMITLSKEDISALQHLFDYFLPEILGIVSSEKEAPTEVVDGLMNLILDIRQGAKNRKDFSVSDHIRDQLKKLNIQVKDGKEGVQWEYEN